MNLTITPIFLSAAMLLSICPSIGLSQALSDGGAKADAKQVPATYVDPSPQSVQMVTVEKDVQLEVLDWGGSGQTVILLSGLGNTAHIWDDFAPLLASQHHVIGITRRGYGASSSPETGYSADRLGDDVLAVMDFLKINQAVLVGHSIAGEELSSVASRHPERVAGLVYLEAANAYAFYDASAGDYFVDLPFMQKLLDQLAKQPFDAKLMKELGDGLPLFVQNMQAMRTRMEGAPSLSTPPTPADTANFSAMRKFMSKSLGGLPPEAEIRQTFSSRPNGGVGAPLGGGSAGAAIMAGEQRYTDIRVPTLAIYAIPVNYGVVVKAGSPQAAVIDAAQAANAKQADAFEKGVPSARVVRIPNASHYIFLSNQAESLREINQFIGSLPHIASSFTTNK